MKDFNIFGNKNYEFIYFTKIRSCKDTMHTLLIDLVQYYFYLYSFLMLRYIFKIIVTVSVNIIRLIH